MQRCQMQIPNAALNARVVVVTLCRLQGSQHMQRGLWGGA